MLLEGSYYSMLILSSDGTIMKGPTRFIYDSRWGKSPECRDIITEAWKEPVEGSLAFKVSEKLKGTRHRLVAWKKVVKPNSKWRIGELKGEIRKGIVDPYVLQEDIKEKEK